MKRRELAGFLLFGLAVLVALPGVAPGASASGAGGRSVLDGVYRLSVTPADLRAIGIPEGDIVPENYGNTTVIFDRGRFAFTQKSSAACTWGYGTVVVTTNRVAMTFKAGGGKAPSGSTNRPGEHFVYGWKLDRGRLSLSAVPGKVSPETLRATSWRRITTKPTRSYLNRNCLPPTNALP